MFQSKSQIPYEYQNFAVQPLFPSTGHIVTFSLKSVKYFNKGPGTSLKRVNLEISNDLRLRLELLCGCGYYTVSICEFCNYYAVAVITQSFCGCLLILGFCVTQMRLCQMKAKKLLTAAPYIDFWAVFVHPYASRPQIVPTQIC